MNMINNFTAVIPVKTADVQRAYQSAQTGGSQQIQKNTSARRFDSVSLGNDHRGAFELELHSKISQDVRTATSSGQINALREQIQSGTYQPDPMEIARKMLLFSESA